MTNPNVPPANNDLGVPMLPGAAQLPTQPNTIRPPIALESAGLQLWQQLYLSGVPITPDGMTFVVDLGSDEATTAWKLSTYGGCTCAIQGKKLEVVLLTSESRVGRYPTPSNALPVGASDSWRQLYALGNGSTTISMSTDHPLWPKVHRLELLGAAQVTEAPGGKKSVTLIEQGQQIQGPAEAEVVGKNNSFA